MIIHLSHAFIKVLCVVNKTAERLLSSLSSKQRRESRMEARIRYEEELGKVVADGGSIPRTTNRVMVQYRKSEATMFVV